MICDYKDTIWHNKFCDGALSQITPSVDTENQQSKKGGKGKGEKTFKRACCDGTIKGKNKSKEVRFKSGLSFEVRLHILLTK